MATNYSITCHLKEAQHLVSRQIGVECRNHNQQGPLSPLWVGNSNHSSFHHLQCTPASHTPNCNLSERMICFFTKTADGRVALACKGVTMACKGAYIHGLSCALTHLNYNLIPHVNHKLLASKQAACLRAYLLC